MDYMKYLGILGGGQQAMAPGILGKELGAQSLGGPGFLGQVDAMPVVGKAVQQGVTPEMFGLAGMLGSQLLGSQGGQEQAQQAPMPLAMQAARQTVGQPDIGDTASMWLRQRLMPQLGLLGRSM